MPRCVNSASAAAIAAATTTTALVVVSAAAAKTAAGAATHAGRGRGGLNHALNVIGKLALADQV